MAESVPEPRRPSSQLQCGVLDSVSAQRFDEQPERSVMLWMSLERHLRVPLHCQQERTRLAFQRLNDSIACPCHYLESGSDAVDRLVVVTVGPDGRSAEACSQTTTSHQLDRVKRCAAHVVLAVLESALDGGQMLMEAAAFRHVYQLNAAAHPQHRFACSPISPVQRQLP